jgi:hypothetical protein
MHSAPPVRITLAHEPVWSASVVALAGAAAANLVAWAALHAQASPVFASGLALFAALMAGCLVWRRLQRRPSASGALVWDGAAWFWSRDEPLASATGDVRVMIDLGAWMVLRFRPDTAGPAPTWLPVTRQRAGALWPQWRAALFSHRPGAAPAVTAERS